jgi:hypothetical protein
VHHLSYGGSELYGDRLWGCAVPTELSQTQTTIIEDDHEPLTTREHGEEVHGLFDFNFGDLSRWGVMAAPETVETRLMD